MELSFSKLGVSSILRTVLSASMGIQSSGMSLHGVTLAIIPRSTWLPGIMNTRKGGTTRLSAARFSRARLRSSLSMRRPSRRGASIPAVSLKCSAPIFEVSHALSIDSPHFPGSLATSLISAWDSSGSFLNAAAAPVAIQGSHLPRNRKPLPRRPMGSRSGGSV
ncbi:uncharacterized protein METZ01_LOCUS129532 [marine metagenome]|uniref:Uncharacterized protein n=1 Tax=marine metagenome TaxID=408172 RepID=A0A381YHX3_9ZZZZ